MGKGRPEKYNRVSSQQKFMLRRLIIKENMSVKQAAEKININYSTAKTIMFSYRQNCHQAINFSLPYSNNSTSIVATYVQTTKTKFIPVISSIGEGSWMKSQFTLHQSTDEHQDEKNVERLMISNN